MTRETSTSTTSNTSFSSGGAKPCSVEAILNDMSSSFASCKSSSLFRFYQESCKKKGECSINWTSNTIAPSTASPSNGSCSNCSSWLPSGNFWSTTTSNFASNGAATTASSDTDVGYASATLNQLLIENRMISHVTQRLEERFTNFMANNTMQITTTGIFLGALAGAAVATGVIMGMMAAGAAASDYVPQFMQLLKRSRRRRTIGKGSSKPSIQEHQNIDPPTPEDRETTNTQKSTSVVSANGPLVIVQAHPSSSLTTTAREQCQSCLQNIESELPEGLQWNHVRRLTVYLVSGKCHASTFRRVLEEYNNHNNNTSSMMVSVLYVQQLEEEAAVLQIEAMASKD